jgi:hypothetical protein
MPDHLDLLRRIAESPSGVIAPCTGIRSVHASMEDVIASLEKLYADGLIVSVRVVRARGDPQGPVAFSARLTSAGRASLARGG